MTFNHYAKLGRIIAGLKPGWYIRRVDEPTMTLRFNGEKQHYSYYYRLYYADGSQIPYGKFQKLDKLAAILKTPIDLLPIRDD